MMRRLFNLFLVAVSLVAIAYPFRDRIQAGFDNLFYVPCAKPIAYSLGSFDTRFNVSKEYFLSAIKDAEAIWEKSVGKDLFVYVPESGPLKIHLIFDYRAAATSKLAAIDVTLKGNQAMYDSLKLKYASLKDHYAQSKSDYDTRVRSFNAKNAEYEKAVDYWNGRGGVPRGTYDELESERQDLQAEASELQSMQAGLNQTVGEINSLVADLNRLAAALNLSVDAYNTIGASRGESFEEGLYQSDGVHEEIDIYEWSDRNKLVRVLAHELGHALGLGHVADPKAVMYEMNQGTDEALSPDDLSALKARCPL